MSSPEPAPKRVLIWDLPTRLLHWLLAGSFLGAFAIATLVDEHSPTYAVHMLLGAVAAIAVIIRVVWGFLGSTYARFRSFSFGPKAVLAYLKGALFGDGEDKPYAGHNPANAWAAFAMLGLTLAVAVTGALIGRFGHAVKEVHEALVFTLLAVVGAHLAGLAWHTFKKRENIALGMLDGKKRAEPSQAIAKAHPLAALLALGLTATAAFGLARGYETSTHSVTVPVIGVSMKVGGGEKGKRERGAPQGDERPRHHHDD